MQNKKLFALLPVVALLGLSACDTITVKPTDYNDVIVTFDNDVEKSKQVYHNIESIIQDAYHDGSLASDVLDRVLYQYAITIFGRYNKVVKGLDASNDSEITLKAAVNSAINGDKTLANKFINEHKAYWTTNDKGKRIDKDGHEVTGDVNASESELARLTAKWSAIENKIAKKLFEAVKGNSSYADRQVYEEIEYANSLARNGKKVDLINGAFSSGVILDSYLPEEAFETVLTRVHYQSNYELDDAETPEQDATYIEDEIIPEIYKSLLVNQYLVDKKYTALGNSYARKVNIIAIPKQVAFPKQDDYFMDSLINLINAKPADPEQGEDPQRSILDPDTFIDYSNAWEGISENPDGSIDILDNINSLDSSLFKPTNEGTEQDEQWYYAGTEYGEMVKDYHKLDNLDDPDTYRTVDSAAVSKFTNSGAYNKEVGRAIEQRKIAAKTVVTSGWYISNGGLTSLPESIRTRLFSFSVAAAYDEREHIQDLDDRWQYDNDSKKWDYVVSENESTYLARINGAYYLKVESSFQGTDPKNDILFYDAGTSTHYVIQVEEAVMPTKIAKTSALDANAYSDEKREEVLNEISDCVAATSSYDSLAKKYWLEQMSLEYHDQTVYDYFKANYPELF